MWDLAEVIKILIKQWPIDEIAHSVQLSTPDAAVAEAVEQEPGMQVTIVNFIYMSLY